MRPRLKFLDEELIERIVSEALDLLATLENRFHQLLGILRRRFWSSKPLEFGKKISLLR